MIEVHVIGLHRVDGAPLLERVSRLLSQTLCATHHVNTHKQWLALDDPLDEWVDEDDEEE